MRLEIIVQDVAEKGARNLASNSLRRLSIADVGNKLATYIFSLAEGSFRIFRCFHCRGEFQLMMQATLSKATSLAARSQSQKSVAEVSRRKGAKDIKD
jgi:hypothetical protein